MKHFNLPFNTQYDIHDLKLCTKPSHVHLSSGNTAASADLVDKDHSVLKLVT